MSLQGFGWRTLSSSLALLSVVGAIGKAFHMKKDGLLRPGHCGPKVLRLQIFKRCAGGTEYPRW